MLWIRCSADTRGLASVSTLASATLPSRLVTPFSRIGVSWRQGPHQAAQKSTTTGSSRERSTTSAWKVASVASKITPASMAAMAEIAVEAGGLTLAGGEAGGGGGGVLLHRLTATRRDVGVGSRALQRDGHRVIAYDARGHGASSPAPSPEAYRYEDLAGDLLAVLDDRGIDRALLCGASMGAHTIVRFALDHGDRVAGLVVVTPAFDPDDTQDEERRLARWDALAEGLRSGGVEGFVEAYGTPKSPERWHETIFKVLRQRMSAHERPAALADALGAVPRSRPFGSWAELAELEVPAVVVASRDEADPEHPYAVGERYAEAIPGAELRSEEPGSSPLAWQGSRLSHLIAELGERV